MKRVATAYHDTYFADTPTNSMRKLPLVARAVSHLIEQLNPFEYCTGADVIARLKQLHAPDYVEAFSTGEGRLAHSNGWRWTRQIRNGVLAMNAGQLAGARAAFERGLAANIYQGAHHALYEHGSAYCTFNGMALVAQEFADKRVMVIDCDEHQGNGTLDFCRRLSNLYCITIFGSDFGGRDSKRGISIGLPTVTKNFALYEEALSQAFIQALEWQPDLIIYNAGADPFIKDPLASLKLTKPQLATRDRMVFEFTLDNGIPCLFNLAGGYCKNIQNTVEIHRQTFEAASVELNRKD